MSIASQSPHKQGFALLELLVAMVILFATVALAAGVVGTVSKSSQSSWRAVHFSRFTPMIVSEIQNLARNEPARLKQELHEGRIWDIDYTWSAEPKVSHRGPRYFSDAESRMVDSSYVFTLWQIKLTMTMGSHQEFKEFEVLTRLYEG